MIFVAANTPTKQSLELKQIREQLNLKQRQMADLLGLDFARYRNYEYRSVPMRILDMARDLLGREGRGLHAMQPRPTGKLRVLGAIGAGESPDYEPDDHFVFVPIEYVRSDYGAIQVASDGYSMLPYIHPGDILIFKRTDIPKPGKIVAARLPGETLPVAKKCVFDSGRLALASFNPDYPTLAIDGARILGVLTGIISVDGSLRLGPEDNGIDEQYIEHQMRSRHN